MNIDFLNQHGVDRVRYYNIQTPIANKVCTVCVFFNSTEGRIEARGVSICSLMDPYNNTKGKNKAFGRAIKALKRKENFYKINGKGRRNEVVRREMKIKSDEELESIDPDFEVMISPSDGTKFLKKYLFDIPLSYPVEVANLYFKYKSQYRPTPVTLYEIRMVQEVENTCTC